MWWNREYFGEPVRQALARGFEEKRVELRPGLRDQEQTLHRVQCPTTFIEAVPTRYSKEGILLAALSDEDCRRADRLLPDNVVVEVRSPHDVHFAHPGRFVEILRDFVTRL